MPYRSVLCAALIAGVVALPAWLPAAGLAEEVAAGNDPLAATVEGREIRRSRVVESARDLPPAYLEQMETIFPFLRDRMVDFELVAIEGREEGLADDPEVRAMMDAFEEEAIRQVYLARLLKQEITDESLKQSYDAFVAATPPVDEVRARHILVETEDAADAIIDELDGGADFAALAGEHSIDLASGREHGGDLGYFVHDEMVPAFADAAFALQPGQHSSEPVETEYGWHILLVEDRRVQQPPAFEDLREQLQGQLAEEIIGARLNELREDADIRRYDYHGQPDDSEPAASE
jgi:peptidyl-prolyl cis-trans isomerase C